MLKYHTTDISCRVIPNEVTLLFNITGCTIKCPGCNERTLWKDKGTPLTVSEVRTIVQNYYCGITCVCFMGGEHAPQEINALARFVKNHFAGIRTAWYSGLDEIAKEIDYCNFNYLKTGSYQAFRGALGTVGTNQRVFEVTEDCSLIDITDKYIRTEPDEVRVLDIVKEDEITEESQDDNIGDEMPIDSDTDDNDELIVEIEATPIDESEEITATESSEDSEHDAIDLNEEASAEVTPIEEETNIPEEETESTPSAEETPQPKPAKKKKTKKKKPSNKPVVDGEASTPEVETGDSTLKDLEPKLPTPKDAEPKDSATKTMPKEKADKAKKAESKTEEPKAKDDEQKNAESKAKNTEQKDVVPKVKDGTSKPKDNKPKAADTPSHPDGIIMEI